MENHLDSLGSRTLRQLVLPASHDSAMYQSGFPASLAQTQTLNIYGQLSVGIRYFDLRPRWSDGEFYLCHGPITGPKLAVVLADLYRFMSEGHRELMLLKFSHYDGISNQTYRAMIEQIKQSLDPWLYRSLPAGQRLADIRLEDYVRPSGRILLLCNGEFPIDNPSAGVWVYRDWDSSHSEQGDLRVYDCYSNTMSVDKMQADQFARFNQYNGRCKDPKIACDLFLLSWTLTPPTAVVHYAQFANQQLGDAVDQLKIPNSFGRRINILYVDDVGSANVTKVAVAQNLRLSRE